MTDIEKLPELQEKVNAIIENDIFCQVKAIVSLRVSIGLLYVTFSFPYTGNQYQEIIGLNSEIAQNEMLLLGHICYLAGKANEWRSIREN